MADSLLPSFFWGNDPNVNQQLRQRVALQMMSQRKGYPKTFGEGLSALGDALGDRGIMRMLEQQDVAAQNAAKLGPPGTQQSEATPETIAEKTAYAPPTETATSPTETAPAVKAIDDATVKDTTPPATTPPATTTSPATAPEPDPWPARSNAIAGIESGGEKNPYGSLGAVTRTGDRAYGKYQIMGANIPEWTKAATGTALTPAQFLASPDAQEATFKHRFGQYVDKYGEEGAARAWYGGERGMKNLNATDVYGRLTVGGYGRDYMDRLNASPRDRVAAAVVNQAATPFAPLPQSQSGAFAAGGAPGMRFIDRNAPLDPEAGLYRDPNMPFSSATAPAPAPQTAQVMPAPQMPPVVPQANPAGPAAASAPALSPLPDQRLALVAPQGNVTTDIKPAPPVPSQLIRPAPVAPVAPQQVAQAQGMPPAGYIMPEHVAPTPPPVVPMSPTELKYQKWVLDNPNNPYVAQRAAPVLAQEKAAREYEQNRRLEQYKADLQFHQQMLSKRQEQIETAAQRTQTYAKGQQGLIEQPAASQAQAPATPQAPGTDPRLGTPQSPQRSGIPTVPPVPPGVTPEKWSELQGPNAAKAIDAYDKAVPQFDEAVKTLQLARNHPGREWGIGSTSEIARKMPGTSAYGFGKIMDQIAGKNFLAAYAQLKGGGQITEIEGSKAEAAQARLATAQNKEDFDKALTDFENALRSDLETVQRKVNRPVTAWRGAGDNASYAPDLGQRRGNKEYIGGNPADPMSWRDIGASQ